jgi:hypothetical protein
MSIGSDAASSLHEINTISTCAGTFGVLHAAALSLLRFVPITPKQAHDGTIRETRQ